MAQQPLPNSNQGVPNLPLFSGGVGTNTNPALNFPIPNLAQLLNNPAIKQIFAMNQAQLNFLNPQATPSSSAKKQGTENLPAKPAVNLTTTNPFSSPNLPATPLQGSLLNTPAHPMGTPINQMMPNLTPLPSTLTADSPATASFVSQLSQMKQAQKLPQTTQTTPAPQIRVGKRGISTTGDSSASEPPHKKAKISNKEETSSKAGDKQIDKHPPATPSNLLDQSSAAANLLQSTPLIPGTPSMFAAALTGAAATPKAQPTTQKEKEKGDKEKEKDGEKGEKDGTSKKSSRKKDKSGSAAGAPIGASEEDFLSMCGVQIEEEAKMLKEQRQQSLLKSLDKDTLEKTKKSVENLKIKPVKNLVDQEKIKKCIEKSFAKNIRKEITEARIFQDIDQQRVPTTTTSKLNAEISEKEKNVKIGNGVISLLSLSVEEYLKNVLEKLVGFAKDRLEFAALVSMKNKQQIEEEIAELNERIEEIQENQKNQMEIEENPENPENLEKKNAENAEIKQLKEKIEQLKSEMKKCAIFEPLKDYGVEKLLKNLQLSQERMRENFKKRRTEMEEKEQERKAKEMSKTERAEQERLSTLAQEQSAMGAFTKKKKVPERTPMSPAGSRRNPNSSLSSSSGASGSADEDKGKKGTPQNPHVITKEDLLKYVEIYHDQANLKLLPYKFL